MEDKNSALSSLLKRKRALESIVLHQKRTRKRSSPNDIVDASKTRSAKCNKPDLCSNSQQKENTPVKTSVNSSTESVDVVENSDVETPIKGIRCTRMSASPDDRINTSTVCLSRSHDFFTSPNTTPFKIINDSSYLSELDTSSSAVKYTTRLISTEAKGVHRYLTPNRQQISETRGDNLVATSQYRVDNARRNIMLSAGPRDSEAPAADHSLQAAQHEVDNARCNIMLSAGPRDSETPAADHSLPAAQHEVDNARCNIMLSPGPRDSETPADDHSLPAAQHEVDYARCNIMLSTGPRDSETPAADHSLPAAHHEVDNARCNIMLSAEPRDSEAPAANHSFAAAQHELDNARCNIMLSPGPRDSEAPAADHSLPAAHHEVDNARCNIMLSAEPRDSEAPAADHSLPAAQHELDNARCNIMLSAGPRDSETPAADHSLPAAHHEVDNARCNIMLSAEPRDSEAPAANHSFAAAQHEVDNARCNIMLSAGPQDSEASATVHSFSASQQHSSNSSKKLTTTQKRRKRRKATTLFKKSCMDFLSDGEEQDFSAGSSDLWSCSSSNVSTEDEQKKKKKIKKKKVATENAGQDREITITKRTKKINKLKMNKQLKNEGKEYLTRKGKVVEAKSLKENPCVPGICKRGCYEISEERRESIFNFYWSLNAQRRRDWLVRCSTVGSIRRKRAVDSNKRNITVDYYLNDGEDHKKVCQKFILCTLDITQRQLNYVVTNALEGMALKDSRKRNAPNKYSESAKANARKFIESLPACPSHYNRKKSKRMYLSQDLRNLSNLYRIYMEACKKNDEEILSEIIFRNIFNAEYDLGFHTPKKDKCVLCTKAENATCEMTEEEKETLKNHKEEKEASYKRFKAHQTLKDVKTVCSSFDLQKVLNTPFGESMLLYYARKYAVFNFTVYESITQEVYCYTWGECDGKRGSNEIATCLYLYLQELDKKGVETALLYCDSCTGQNKNKVVLSLLNYVLLKSDNLKTIQINYLLPGHTYMPADSVHATIESEVKKIIVWSPTQWASYFETARKKPKAYKVNVLEHTDFINWEELAAKSFTKETCKNVKFKNIRIATFKKKNLNTTEIKYSMNEDAASEKVTLFEKASKKGKGKGKGKNRKINETQTSHNQDLDYLQELNNIILQPSYKNKIAISALKYKDLKKLCIDGTIPKRFHRDYLDMPHCSNKNDSLIDTDEEDEDSDDQSKD